LSVVVLGCPSRQQTTNNQQLTTNTAGFYMMLSASTSTLHLMPRGKDISRSRDFNGVVIVAVKRLRSMTW